MKVYMLTALLVFGMLGATPAIAADARSEDLCSLLAAVVDGETIESEALQSASNRYLPATLGEIEECDPTWTLEIIDESDEATNRVCVYLVSVELQCASVGISVSIQYSGTNAYYQTTVDYGGSASLMAGSVSTGGAGCEWTAIMGACSDSYTNTDVTCATNTQTAISIAWTVVSAQDTATCPVDPWA